MGGFFGSSGGGGGISYQEAQQQTNAALARQRAEMQKIMKQQHEREMQRQYELEKQRQERERENRIAQEQKIREMQKQQLAELKAQYAKQEEELRKRNEEFQKQQRLKEKQSNSTLKNTLMEEKMILENQYNEKNQQLTKLITEIRDVHSEVFWENKSIEHFEIERTDKNTRLIIALGQTGVGKSTFCNRFIGDISRKGDKGTKSVGFFKVGSRSLKSETCKIEKKTIINSINNIEYSIVDTPGAGDSENRETQFQNNLVLYLRGCGGVNSFLIFFDLASFRFTSYFQDLLKYYQLLLGKNVWKHVIIIATKSDVVDEDDLPDIKNEMRCEIMDKMELDEKDAELPIITFGKKEYENSLKILVNTISSEKYNCDAISSPIDELRMKEMQLNNKRDELAKEVDFILSKMGNVEGKISMIDENLNCSG